ncbi:MAG: hypothetical protein NWR83_05750 [Salibacteraceae bacterium]|jgi:hypothetical protein|nr:hypothetical protein [Salibacteraceae bacterium]MDP4843945.1 hypothetical protein [Salibacteraceae bacterium]
MIIMTIPPKPKQLNTSVLQKKNPWLFAVYALINDAVRTIAPKKKYMFQLGFEPQRSSFGRKPKTANY